MDSFKIFVICRESRKSKKKSKKKERDRERDRDRDREREKEKKEKSNELDDDLLEDSVNSKDPASSVQLQKRRERLLKWKQDKLEQSILAKVKEMKFTSKETRRCLFHQETIR